MKYITPHDENGFISIEKQWQSGDRVRIGFEHDIQQHDLPNGEVYMKRGPLVFAYPIPHRDEVIKKYAGSNFIDYHSYPLNENFKSITLPPQDHWLMDYTESSLHSNPWYENQPTLHADGISLVPMGDTVLRRVTFPKDDTQK